MERIQLLHPEGKKGSPMLETITENEEISFKELANVLQNKLRGNWEGSVTWYVTAVKLALEARGLIERFPNNRQQYIRMAKTK